MRTILLSLTCILAAACGALFTGLGAEEEAKPLPGKEGAKYVYAGTYDGGSGAGDITLSVMGEHTAKSKVHVLCTWDGEEYEYEGEFEPLGEDGALTGTCVVDDEDWFIKGSIKEGHLKVEYGKVDDDEVDGEMDCKLVPAKAE